MQDGTQETHRTTNKNSSSIHIKDMNGLAHEARAGVQKLDEQFRAVCRENPVAVMCGAAAIGFVIGRWIAKR